MLGYLKGWGGVFEPQKPAFIESALPHILF